MSCKYQNIKVVEGNEFSLLITLRSRTYTINGVPVDEDIDPAVIENCRVMFGGVEYAHTVRDEGVLVIIPGTLAKGTYNLVMTGTYHGGALRAAYFEAVTIVAWNMQADAEQYLQGSPVVLNAAYVIGGPFTDEELERLKAEARAAKRAAEAAEAAAIAAKEDYDRKAEQLDDVAQQSTLTAGIAAQALQGENAEATNTAIMQLIINEGIPRAEEYAEEIRGIIGDWSESESE